MLKTTILLLIFCTTALAQVRTWTDTQGRQIRGEYLESDDTTVKLDVQGRTYTLPLDTLSEDDRSYIQEHRLFKETLVIDLTDGTIMGKPFSEVVKKYDTLEEAEQAAQNFKKWLSEETGVSEKELVTKLGIHVTASKQYKAITIHIELTPEDAPDLRTWSALATYPGRITPDITSADDPHELYNMLEPLKADKGTKSLYPDAFTFSKELDKFASMDSSESPFGGRILAAYTLDYGSQTIGRCMINPNTRQLLHLSIELPHEVMMENEIPYDDPNTPGPF